MHVSTIAVQGRYILWRVEKYLLMRFFLLIGRQLPMGQDFSFTLDQSIEVAMLTKANVFFFWRGHPL